MGFIVGSPLRFCLYLASISHVISHFKVDHIHEVIEHINRYLDLKDLAIAEFSTRRGHQNLYILVKTTAQVFTSSSKPRSAKGAYSG